MALVVNTNMNSLSIENTLTSTNTAVSASLTRLSSGLRINSAQDDPAGYAIANSFKASIASMQVASQNASQAQSLLQNADGAYSQINNILVQMKSIATEASSGQESSNNLNSLQNEFTDLQSEIDQIAKSTVYGGTTLIAGTGTNGAKSLVVTFQIGSSNNSLDQFSVSLTSAGIDGLGLSFASTSIGTQASAQQAMDKLDKALTSINSYMGTVGGFQNQLQYAMSNLTTSIQNYTSSASTIEDVDMASEVSNMTKNNILQQSAMAMLAQANSQPQQILKLLG
ncbi:MAG: flagellin [Syntrophobacteraceae bacterium]|nr:flagellin [Syntrophobacteraceae bacterium]